MIAGESAIGGKQVVHDPVPVAVLGIVGVPPTDNGQSMASQSANGDSAEH